ncbi:MAG: glycosyltransferase family 1 protein [Deltaproteobacteria bacterium]
MTKPIHVGVDATTWWNDRGFGRFTRELLIALLEREDSGFEYTLVVDRKPDDAFPKNAKVMSVDTAKNLDESAVGDTSRSPLYLFKLGAALRRQKFDLFFYPAVYSYFPMLARMPCVVCYHDTTAERFPKLIFPTTKNYRLWQAKTFLARAQTTRAMTVSQASARDLEQILHFSRNKIDVVTEAADPVFRVTGDAEHTRRVREQHGIGEDRRVLIYVGGMNPHKNLLGLLKAMPDVVKKTPDVHLAIVGSTSGKGFWDDIPGLMRFVEDNPPLSEHVTFTGYMSDEDLVALFQTASALVFPSLWEGFGLPAVEAMACGVPVLASRRGSLPEVVGDAGLFFDPESPWAMYTTITKFLDNTEMQEDLRKKALARAETFTWSRAAELAEVCFRKCVQDGRR